MKKALGFTSRAGGRRIAVITFAGENGINRSAICRGEISGEWKWNAIFRGNPD